MANKSFSIYSTKEDTVPGIHDRLLLEIGKTHLACIDTNEHKKTVSTFELFNFTENETADFSRLFSSISSASKLLAKPYPETIIFINNEQSLLVPIFKFNTEIAEDYLNVVFGEDPFSAIHFDHLPIEPGMMNVYRVQQTLLNILHTNFTKVTFRHTYSNIIKTIISDIFTYPSECIYIQFYNTFLIVTVAKDEKLQLIQSFMYEAPEDVLYCLLNITERFDLNREKLILEISGMIDLHFTLYRDLITYFKNVAVQNVDTSKFNLDIKEYPLHYFTPFFNLAL